MSSWTDLAEAARSAAAAVMPSALGALIGSLHEKGLAWGDRAIALLTGIVVSYYVKLGLQVWVGFNDFAGQAVSFVVAMIAYKATPRFIQAASDQIAELPGKLFGWLPSRKEKP